MNDNDNKSKPAKASAGLDPLALLREAMKAVPSVRYALGVVGIGAAVSIVLTLITDYRVAIAGVATMLVFMVLLALFQRLSALESRSFRYPALFVLWTVPALMVAALALVLSSVFFGWPLAWNQGFGGGPAASTKPAATPLAVTLSLARDESPYLARRLTRPPPPVAARYKSATNYPTGYFLWPELDYNLLLFTIHAGEETSPRLFMDRATFLDESDPARRAKNVRVWTMFEALGRRLRPLYKQAGDQHTVLRRLVRTPPKGDAQLGIAFLRVVYPDLRDGDPAAKRAARDTAVHLADSLIPTGAVVTANDDERLDDAVRLLATHRVQPVFDLSTINGVPSRVVTSIRLDVLEVIGAYSALDSGPLTPVDTVIFDLGSKPETLVQPLKTPIKIAANDAVVLRAQLRSKLMFAYLCRLSLLSGDTIVGKSEDFLVDFGFQPPDP